MNVYDFDGTMYRGDSSVDFYLFSLRRHPSVIALWPRQVAAFFRYKARKCDKTEMKTVFFSYLQKIPDIDSEVVLFWNSHEKKIYPWYREQKRDDDTVISASPEFLLGEMMKRLELAAPIGSRVDKKSGRFLGANCHDKEKVVRFREAHGEAEIDEFYSDSRSDAPLAALAKRAYFIRKGKPEPWGEVVLLDEYR